MRTLSGYSPVWAEINLDAIAHNLDIVRKLTRPSVKIMAVVKADGYGHGAVTVANVAINSGANALGVARLSEAMILRRAGLKLPILIFGFTDPIHAATLINNNLTQTVFSLSYAKSINYHARSVGGKVTVHVKIDTGMGRLGLPVRPPETEGTMFNQSLESLCEQIHQIYTLENIHIEGIYTHFAASDSSDKSGAQFQLNLFNHVIRRLESNNLDIQIKHAANSGAIINFPNAHFDMIRPGIMMYGLLPSEETIIQGFQIKPAMQIKARIAQLKEVQPGFKVSYGHSYTTTKQTKLATIPIGYGDGFSRNLSSCGDMLVKGQRAPVVGRVCMDMTIIDVGHIDSISLTDEVVIIGRQGDEEISADEMARHLGTINYEVVTRLMPRVPRVVV